jgi:hypothetical protein
MLALSLSDDREHRHRTELCLNQPKDEATTIAAAKEKT